MGGNDKLASAILNFHLALSDCELQDLGYTGPMTTWTNKRGGKGFIQERVDCFICDEAWRNQFSWQKVEHLSFARSDHGPILICLNQGKRRRGVHKLRPFCLEPF